MSSWTNALLEIAATILAPNRCAACDAGVPLVTAFCPACAATLVRAPPDPTTLASFLYGGALAQAITRFKYERRPELVRPLAAVLIRAVAPLALDPPDAVVPVPLHPSRLAERGFNQAALLARPVARVLGAEALPCALRRVRETPPQALLDRDARLANLVEAFAVHLPRSVRGKRVLLVDDVRTTGATLRACSDVLLAAGSREVLRAVVARAP
jgi:ComF family protein